MRRGRVIRAVQTCLTDELRRQRYRGHPNPLRGHCAVATEAVYFLLGGRKAGWAPTTLRVSKDEVHWFLRHRKTGEVVDPTAGQFVCELEYERGRGRGLPTPKRGAKEQPPSRRAAAVIACARGKLR
jgi:hypothetical protein